MFRLDRIAAIAGIVAAVAAVIALWPIFFPPTPLASSSSAQTQVPKIADYSTGWIDGDGKSTPYYCDPRKAALEKQYPEFKIEMSYLPEQHQDNRDALGIKHDKYMYGCSFAAVKKP
jgi:hypothetical protein